MDSCSSMLHLGGKQQDAIDYDLSCRLDVLGLADGEAEEQLDEKLMDEAKELGVDIDLSPHLKPSSTRTDSSVPTRRSVSIYSTASQSTDVTSNISEVSKEHHHPNDKRNSRASLSLRDYDIFLARGTTNDRRTSISFSQPSTPSNSVFSLPLHYPEASPKKHFRVRKGLSILKLHRSDSTSSGADGCPHCPQDPISQRRAVHKLPCGHKLCTQALRNTIRSAISNKVGGVPSCCGMPIPSSLVEQVMTQEEQNALLDKLEQWDEAVSIAPSVRSEIKDQGSDKRRSTGSRRKSNESKADSVAPHAESELEKLQDRSDFKKLHQEQVRLKDSFLAWIERQRAELQSSHQRLRSEMDAFHQCAEEELFEHHAEAMADAEDKQVKAEADMREAHAQEKRDHATALKHMEAYCAGTYSTGEAHNRTITEQGRAELEKARRIRDAMDSKHESAINVLRGEQGRRMKLREQRQDKEVQELRRSHRKKELELERTCSAELHRLDDFVAERQRKIRARWELQNAVFVKRVEVETGIGLSGKPRSVEWPAEAVPDTESGAVRAWEKDGVSSTLELSPKLRKRE